MMPKETNSRKALKGISSQTLVTGVIGVMEILVFSIMSRLLSKEEFGLYASISAVAVIFGSLSEAGIGSALIQKKDPDTSYINTSFTISFILGVGFSVLLVILSGVLSRTLLTESLKFPLMIMSVTILCNSLTSVNRGIMHRRLEFLKAGIVNFISLFVSAIVAIVMALYGFGFEAIISKTVVYSILATIISYFFVKTRFRFQIDRNATKSIVNFGGWLTLSVILRNFAAQVDKILMSKFLSVVSLGAYNRPKEFINTISSNLNGIFDTALFPVLSGIQDNNESIKNAYYTSLYYMNIFSMFLALVFIFNTNLIIRIFFGEEWLNISIIFIILSVSVVFNIDGRLCDCFFRSLALVKYQFFIRVFEFILTITFLFIGFKWDIIGASIAILCANIITVVVKIIIISSEIGVAVGGVIKKIMSAWQFAIVMVPVMIVLRCWLPNTFLGDTINMVVFGSIALLLFIVMPSVVGPTYKQGPYKIIIQKLKGR